MFVVLMAFLRGLEVVEAGPSEGWGEGSVASMLYLVQHYGVLLP